MPTYEYECTKGHHFEVEQSINDPALKRCRVCRSKAKRLISATRFILKGGGWYSDGYGSAKPASGSSGESKSEAKTETKSEAKSETKSSGGDAKPAKGKSGSGSSASAA